MKYLLLILLLSGCTFRVETRSDTQIEEADKESRNSKLAASCVAKCAPYLPIAFLPTDYRCICEANK